MHSKLSELTNSTPTVISLRLLSGRIPIHLTSPNSGPLSLIQTIRSFSLSPDSSISFLSWWYRGESLWIGIDRSEYWPRYGTSWSLRTLWMAAKKPQLGSQVKKRFFLNTPSQVPFPLLSCQTNVSQRIISSIGIGHMTDTLQVQYKTRDNQYNIWISSTGF